ncbi:hypothetical protein [Limnohabitans sp.]|jgi:hypothetical protein|uniref:hypothetical protein n=1 Tax=Limnohabitans sp. TaxID=1907725 RepID=UPI0037BF50A5
MDRFVPRDDGEFVISSDASAMDGSVPRDDGEFVIASEARQSLRDVHDLQN